MADSRLDWSPGDLESLHRQWIVFGLESGLSQILGFEMTPSDRSEGVSPIYPIARPPALSSVKGNRR